jgi:hypothetical protein
MNAVHKALLETYGNGFEVWKATGILLPIAGGADPALGKGYNETADILFQTIDGVPLDELYQEFIDTLAILNAQRSPLVSRLMFSVDKPFEQVMPIAGAEFEEATEYGQPQGVRLGLPWNMGYDLRYFDLGQRYTFRFLGRAPANEIRALNNAALEADQRLVAKTILNRIFDNTNTSVTLEATGTVTTAYPFYNGDITALPAAPPAWKTHTFTTSHTHYGVTGASTVVSADLDTSYEHIYEHGFGQGDPEWLLLCNRVEALTIRTFRVASGDRYDFIPSQQDAAATFLGVLVGQLPGKDAGDPDVFPGFIGSYGPIDIIEEDYIPAGYMVLICSGGKFAQTNPVGLREHDHPALRGLKLIPMFERYPLREAYYHHAVGAGIRYGGAGYVMQVTSGGSYAIPPTLLLQGQGGR